MYFADGLGMCLVTCGSWFVASDLWCRISFFFQNNPNNTSVAVHIEFGNSIPFRPTEVWFSLQWKRSSGVYEKPLTSSWQQCEMDAKLVSSFSHQCSKNTRLWLQAYVCSCVALLFGCCLCAGRVSISQSGLNLFTNSDLVRICPCSCLLCAVMWYCVGSFQSRVGRCREMHCFHIFPVVM